MLTIQYSLQMQTFTHQVYSFLCWSAFFFRDYYIWIAVTYLERPINLYLQNTICMYCTCMLFKFVKKNLLSKNLYELERLFLCVVYRRWCIKVEGGKWTREAFIWSGAVIFVCSRMNRFIVFWNQKLNGKTYRINCIIS